jgi:hypothetical protein
MRLRCAASAGGVRSPHTGAKSAHRATARANAPRGHRPPHCAPRSTTSHGGSGVRSPHQRCEVQTRGAKSAGGTGPRRSEGARGGRGLDARRLSERTVPPTPHSAPLITTSHGASGVRSPHQGCEVNSRGAKSTAGVPTCRTRHASPPVAARPRASPIESVDVGRCACDDGAPTAGGSGRRLSGQRAREPSR